MNIIECTIKMKRETQTNYQNLSLAVTSKELKRLFSMLAAAEDEHISKLLAINEELNRSATVENRLSVSVCAYNPLIDARNPGKALRHDPDAYQHMLKNEEETIEFFDKLADQAENAAVKKACLAAAEKEREHMQMVENIYAFAEDPRTYLEWGEFSNMRTL